jgi:hypothetical protein
VTPIEGFAGGKLMRIKLSGLSLCKAGDWGLQTSMRIKLSGLPLCKAGDWGLQTPEKCFCFGFFAAKPQKN